MKTHVLKFPVYTASTLYGYKIFKGAINFPLGSRSLIFVMLTVHHFADLAICNKSLLRSKFILMDMNSSMAIKLDIMFLAIDSRHYCKINQSAKHFDKNKSKLIRIKYLKLNIKSVDQLLMLPTQLVQLHSE